MGWRDHDSLSSEVGIVLAAVAEAAPEPESVFLVGGLVRDLLLGRSTRDVDLVVTGDGLAVAQRLGERLGVAVDAHDTFRTAECTFGTVRVDIASARRERYPAPAALPEVEPADLAADLARRDFAANAMALPLGAGSLAEVVDPQGGQADLAARRLRVLHPSSFRDDPTRILRGVELSVRLDFSLEATTVGLAREAAAAGYARALSPARLRQAWMRAFADLSGLAEKVGLLAELGFLGGLGGDGAPPAAGGVEALAAALAALGDRGPEPGEAVLLWLAARGGPLIEEALAGRFAAPELGGVGTRLRAAATRLATDRPCHEIEAAVGGLSEAELAVLMATAPPAAADRARRVLLEWRPLRLGIGGGELVAAGHAPGPAIGDALRRTRAARLDGEIEASGELAFALAWLAGRRGRS